MYKIAVTHAMIFATLALFGCEQAVIYRAPTEVEEPRADEVEVEVEDPITPAPQEPEPQEPEPQEPEPQEPEPQEPEPQEPEPEPVDEDLFSQLPTGPEQLTNICGRQNDNALTRAFCGASVPDIRGLTDLQRALGLDFVDVRPGRNGRGGNPSFAISGHSSSLVTKSVSAINPRTIVFSRRRRDRDDRELVALGFTRGDQFAEVMTFTDDDVLSLYLFKYRRDCDDTLAGCTHADKLLPETESDWTGFDIYEDVDLKNTVLDCLQCHQPGGPGSAKMMRMQELQNPWNHWFRDNRQGGQSLLADFHLTHGTDEDYGGIPAAMIDDSDPARLEDFVRNGGFGNQPNEFNSNNIEDEVAQDGHSETWQPLFAAAVRGEVIPPPYFGIKVTDPVKLQDASDAYRAAKNGSGRGSLPDIRRVFDDDILPYLSQAPKPGLDGRGILTHMCTQCHNSNLDQSISRARFDITRLDDMSRAEKDLAIERLLLPRTSRLAMPPTFFRDMSDDEVGLAVDVLLQ